MVSAPIARPGGGFASSIREKELWSQSRTPSQKEWEMACLEASVEMASYQEPDLSNTSEEVVFQKPRLIKIGRKVRQLGWKDLPPPEYV